MRVLKFSSLFVGIFMSFNLYSQCPNVPEVCDNGIDDDCDGLIDCFDGSCSESISCTSFYFGRDSGDCQVAPPVVSGYNLVEKWRSVVDVETRGTPIVGDLDGDGIPEVVTHFRDNNTVYILNGADGTTKATINAHLSDYSQSPSIVDADGDGFGEVYLVDFLGRLKCFDHLGQPKDGFTEITISKGQGNHQGIFSANPSFADFDGDGNPELFIGNEIYNSSSGALISQLTNHYNESKGAIGVNGHVFSAAFDILPDDFCSDCSGLELICGNVVYSVNMVSGALTEVSKAPNKVNDGKVSLADWDGDGQMDIVVSGTCCGDGGVIYIWDPRTQDFVTQDAAGNPLLANPFDVQPSLPNQVGLASIADFDGDGLLEIGMAGRHEFITIESDMTRKWNINVVDQSNMTTSTAFDFEGDGKTEVVYRDENNLYIIDGATGSIITQIPCGSGTRTELPVVVDVNGDGDAELVCTCSDTPGGGKGNVRVYESDSTIWVPTRKVWNTHNYVPTFINDDLTVPKEFQNKALIPGQDIYLTQTPLTYATGNPVYPVLPDYTVQIDSVAKSCDSETAKAHVKICQETDNALVFDFDVSFYKGDPKNNGTLIGTERIDHSASSLIISGCMTIDYPLPWGDYDLHVFVNDKGVNPSNAPIILMPECDTTNNEVSIALSTCNQEVDSLSCFIMMTDFEDYVNCPAPGYDSFTEAYAGNSAWVNSNHTAGIFIQDPGVCENIPDNNLMPHSDGGKAYAGLHSPFSTNPTSQEVIIGTLPSNLYANQKYKISFLAFSSLVRNESVWDSFGELDFFGIEENSNPTLDINTQKNWMTISGIPEVDHLGTSATINNRTQWEEYSIEFTPTRDYDRLLLAPRGNFAYVAIDNIVVKVADQNISIDTIDVCQEASQAILPYTVTGGNPTEYSIDWEDAINNLGISDVAQSILPSDSQFVVSGLDSVPAGVYKAELRVYNTLLKCEGVDSIFLVINPCKTDLGVTKTDGTDKYFSGTTTIYSIVVKNLGPSLVENGLVSDPIPTGISAGDITWTATPYGGATSIISGVQNGALLDTVDIPVNDSIVYTVNISVPLNFVGDLENTVTITSDNDTFPDNNTATDIDTKDCNFQTEGSIDSKNAGWVKMGNVINGVPYQISYKGGTKTFIPTDGPEQGQEITTVVYNTATGWSVSLSRHRYNNSNNYGNTISSYDNTPHSWTGLSGIGYEKPPILGFMAFIDQNGNGTFDSGLEEYFRDITSLKFAPSATGELYMAFYDDGVYTDNAGIINISVQSELESTDLGQDTAVCLGESILLDAQNPDAGSWEWNTSETSQTISVDSAGEYSVKVTSVGGCEINDTINIKTHSINVLLPSDTSVCRGESVQFTAHSDSAIIWNWHIGETGKTITVDSSYIYKVVVYDKFGCSDSDSVGLTVDTLPIVLVNSETICPGDTILFTALSNSAKEYVWSKKGTGAKQTTIGYEEGDYKVVVTDENSCKDSTEAKLIFHLPPTVTVNNDTICKGDSPAIFKATSSTAKQYVWSEKGIGTNVQTTGVDSGRYTVIVTDSNSCKDTATGVLHVDTLPIVIVNDTIICSNVSSINISAKSSTAVKYLWGDLGFGTNQTISVSAAGKYSVVVTDENNCEQKDSAILQKVQQPGQFEIEGDSIACEGDEIELLADINTQIILWETGEKSKKIKVTTTGEYGVFVANEAFGVTCSDSATFKTAFLPYPEEPDIKDFTNCFTYNTPFKIDIPTTANVSWDDFGGRIDSTLLINEEGRYYATLSIYPQCSISAEVNVEEFCPGVFFVPNAFTPDGNSINDFFTTKGYNLLSFNIWIFNRWGQQIFTSSNLDNWWDGTFMGRPCQIDVYVWKAKYSFNNENGGLEEKSVLGRVSLIR